MKIWKNTSTLDNFVPELKNTVEEFNAEIAIIGSKPINLSLMPNLKAIFKCGVGTDNVPFDEAEKRNIEVILPSKKTKEYIFEETANFTIYLVLRMIYRKLGSVENWDKKSREFLGYKKVLVLGQGNIGKLVSYKLRPLVNVLTYDPIDNKESDLKDLISQSDVITLHIPLNSKTKCFIDERKLALMKNSAILINTSRGEVVDEDALYQEMAKGRVFAAFDVFWNEPYNGILKSFYPERFYMTPHIASNCRNFLEGLAMDLKSYLRTLANN